MEQVLTEARTDCLNQHREMSRIVDSVDSSEIKLRKLVDSILEFNANVRGKVQGAPDANEARVIGEAFASASKSLGKYDEMMDSIAWCICSNISPDQQLKQIRNLLI